MFKTTLSFMLMFIVVSMSGCAKLKQYNALDDQAMDAYTGMFNKALETGDPVEAMMNDYLVLPNVSNDDIAKSINKLAEEYNMRVTGDVKMFTKADAKPDEIKHARIFSICNLHIAKVLMNYSHYYSGLMPCRITLIEYGNGERHLVTMNLQLAIHGGRPLPKKILKLATHVKKAMEEIPARAAKNDFKTSY